MFKFHEQLKFKICFCRFGCTGIHAELIAVKIFRLWSLSLL